MYICMKPGGEIASICPDKIRTGESWFKSDEDSVRVFKPWTHCYNCFY